jgi:hypothetical protein
MRLILVVENLYGSMLNHTCKFNIKYISYNAVLRYFIDYIFFYFSEPNYLSGKKTFTRNSLTSSKTPEHFSNQVNKPLVPKVYNLNIIK